jgi:hypothetical protein
MKYSALFIISLFCVNSLFAQQKFEREVRIDADAVPAAAIDYVKQLQFSSKIKWFKETGLNTTSFEAKTKYKGKKYSIEFSNDGTLEDVEIIVNKKKLPQKTYKNISQYLQKDLSKFKWVKIQIQYSGDEKAVREKIVTGNLTEGLITRYELIVSCKLNKKYQKLEYLFSNTGDFIERKTIILPNTDNLEY